MRLFGALLLLAAAVVGVIGVAYTTFAIIGTEWDYCPRRNECIAGELVGLGIIGVAAIAAWTAIRILRTK